MLYSETSVKYTSERDVSVTPFPDSLRAFQSGAAERPMRSSGWVLPHDVRHDDRELWWVLELRAEWRMTAGGRGMLEEFLQLKDKPNDSIAQFARKWGGLGVFQPSPGRRYNGPFPRRRKSHPPVFDWKLSEWWADFEGGADFRFAEYRETFEEWRYWINKFSSVIRLSAANMADQIDEEALRELLGRKTPPKVVEKPGMWKAYKFGDITILAHRQDINDLLAREVADWCKIADLGLALRPPFDDSWGDLRLELITHCLLAGLLLQLMAAIGGVSGYSICSACGTVYSPERQPRVGERHYCNRPLCKKAAASQRQRRKRQLAQKR